MDLNALKRPLGIDEIDFRVQSSKDGKAVILAYKDARADMTRLDEAVGPLGWKREHSNGNANCTVSLWDKEAGQWISKEDTGAESYSDKEKGLASDSFKRACFNWGIGRELYDYPTIRVDLTEFEQQNKWALQPKYWTWFSQFNSEGVLLYLAAKDKNGKKRFAWGTYDPNLEEKTVEDKTQEIEEEKVETVRGTTDEEEAGNVEGVVKKPAEPIEEAEETGLDRATLAEEYERLFGKKPHGRMKPESIAEAIDKAKVKFDDEEEEEETVEETTSQDVYTDTEDSSFTEAVEIKTEESEISMAMALIEGYNDVKALGKWAVEMVNKASNEGAVAKEITDFKKAVNAHAQVLIDKEG